MKTKSIILWLNYFWLPLSETLNMRIGGYTAMISIHLKKVSPSWIAGMTGILVGLGSVFCLRANDGDFCALLIAAPLYIMWVVARLDGAWSYLIGPAYYLAIFMLPVYLHGYLLPKFLNSKYCLMAAIAIAAAVHITLSFLGVKLMGDIVRGLGDAFSTAIHSGALDSFFRHP